MYAENRACLEIGLLKVLCVREGSAQFDDPNPGPHARAEPLLFPAAYRC